MCGFVGVVNPSDKIDVASLRTMRDALAHRGPDGAGEWSSPEGNVLLGHRRLAVIDPSPAGSQPMVSPCGQVALVFNGEIYNFMDLREELRSAGYQFRSSCDTEVLLACYLRWGCDCVPRLAGMFAFAIYDRRLGKVLMARDRAGEKPLFYGSVGHSFVFCSELKALTRVDAICRKLNPVALQEYLAYGYISGENSIYSQFKKVLPGTTAEYCTRSGSIRVRRYWFLPEQCSRPLESEDAVLSELEHHLKESVRRCLVADVPVAVLLSGGIDSALITAMASQINGGGVRTFTVVLPGDSVSDESRLAGMIANACGTIHTEVPVGLASVGILPVLARQFDEPIADSSMIPTYLVCQAVRRSATVALSGDGGDELFGGYPHVSWLLRIEWMRNIIPPVFRKVLACSAGRLPIGIRGRHHLMGFRGSLGESIAKVNLLFDHRARREVLNGDLLPLGGSLDPESKRARMFGNSHSVVSRATAVDFSAYLADDLLVKVDRASMLSSLEVRSPWLDHRLVEFAFQLPAHLRATTRRTKVLPRKMARRYFPDAISGAPKRGFTIPLDRWFSGDLGEFARDTLLSSQGTIFSRNAVHRLLVDQARGRHNVHRLFALVFFELWRKEYGAHL
jgi:asparagine synthase (glutamine-hydrolysing)